MSFQWVKVEKVTARKPEVLRIASKLNLHLDHAFGLCVRFWIWCDDNLETGSAIGVTPVALDALLNCDGFAQTLIEVGWLRVRNGSLEVPNYDRHLSENAKKRAHSQERMQVYRKKASQKCSAKSVTTASPEIEIEIDRRKEEKEEVYRSEETELLTIWNDRMRRKDRLTDKRRKAFRARLEDRWWLDNWRESIERAVEMPFLNGDNDRGWRADLDWFLKPDSVTKIMEGKYESKTPVGVVYDPLAEYEDLDA
ncbi:hypothetical protein VN12_19765 [Pirellula sp. SH-Sr6A]|uniref:hypothetical protein n=1 Tax=Pirellula sp. SH-Sr6A TaxID=1632865 RepID=UPI00078D3823|nr:hypothetical protein [Pirellula sp. SH-Sr6A]AMV30864.1 hypothetical protein VN12_02025 [Pirellula sp. SH-Sr6A]AMV34373.1 hypothetical protein VN12_19765 [Pirellula sp. SH-Sr6A]